MRAIRMTMVSVVVVLAVLAGIGWAFHKSHARSALLLADIDHVSAYPALAASARARGRRIFLDQCAACHGAAARGDRSAGVPDLTDRDFLYGQGRASEIEQIVLHGIRSGDSKGWRLAVMPAYGTARPSATEPLKPLSPAAINNIIQYLRKRAGLPHEAASAALGGPVFSGSGGCWDCHGPEGYGDSAIGAPNLVDRIWLYGDGSPAWVFRSISEGRHGRCPAFVRRLDPVSIRQVAIYVASLVTGGKS
jgi:cytochrome c oxidase cbb3-type subunit 3